MAASLVVPLVELHPVPEAVLPSAHRVELPPVPDVVLPEVPGVALPPVPRGADTDGSPLDAPSTAWLY